MRFFVLIAFLICFLNQPLRCQNYDSLNASVGVSITNFGDCLTNIYRKNKLHRPVYFDDLYSGGYYWLGLNYRIHKNTIVNRVSFLFSNKSLISKDKRNKDKFAYKFYELALMVGHEWHHKKQKWFYYGTEMYYGRSFKETNYSPSNYAVWRFDEIGLNGFSGVDLKISKKFRVRSEINLGFAFSHLYNDGYTHNDVEFRPIKLLSLELYYKL